MSDTGTEPRSARDWLTRLSSNFRYRQSASEDRRLKSSRVGKLLTHDPLVAALWDGAVGAACGLTPREAEKWLAIVMADRGCDPREVGKALWSRPAVIVGKQKCDPEHVAELLIGAYTLLASGEAATNPDEEAE
jgi:hypothetical protein